VSASVTVVPKPGLRARLLAEATAAVLAGGALQAALGRMAREAAATDEPAGAFAYLAAAA
jgi:hypothetical protein